MKEYKLKGDWWWGFLHRNGTIQIKRWLGDHQDYTSDCQSNPLVKIVVRPFRADTWEEAIKIINMQLGKNKK